MRIFGSTADWRALRAEQRQALHPNLLRELEVCTDMLQFFSNCEACAPEIVKLFKAKGLTWAKEGDPFDASAV